MGVIKCFECGNKVSEYADKCPSCGCPIDLIKEHIKKKDYKLTFGATGTTINLIGLEEKITEEELKEGSKLWKIFRDDYKLEYSTFHTIYSMFKFNGFKFPNNYQECYEAMCQRNRNNGPKCPTCGSTNVIKLKQPWIVPLYTEPKQFKCQSCGYEW